MPILVITEKADPEKISAMSQEYESMIKIVVDVRKKILAGGGEMHADCETELLDSGSEQSDLWGANWYPDEQRIEYESLINIRPTMGFKSIVLQDESLRKKVKDVTENLLGGVP
jgi:hypothetical protein